MPEVVYDNGERHEVLNSTLAVDKTPGTHFDLRLEPPRFRADTNIWAIVGLHKGCAEKGGRGGVSQDRIRTCRSPLLCMPLELALADWLSWSRSAASSASFAARSVSNCDVLPCGAGGSASASDMGTIRARMDVY